MAETQERTGLARFFLGDGKDRTAAREAAVKAAAPPPRTKTEIRQSAGSGSRMGAGAVGLPARVEDAPARVKPAPVKAKPSTDPNAIKRAEGFIKGFRRELTQDEWDRLSAPQQQSVRFNSELIKAYDADQADGSSDRRNTKSLISQLGLDARTQEEVTTGLSGLGPAVRYDELFAKPASGVSTKDVPGGNRFTAPSVAVVADPKDKRQVQVNQIAAHLQAFLTGQDKKNAEAELPGALGKPYSFQSPQAKADYEVSFEFLRDRNALGTASWADAVRDLQTAGYDPEDFKAYALDRIQLLPNVEGQSTLADLTAWFG